MRTGICTSDFKPSSVETIFKRINSYGISAIQFTYASFMMDEIPERIGDDTLIQIQRYSEKYDIEIVAGTATFNMIDPDEGRLEENIRRMDQMCAANKKLGCSILSLCTGTLNPNSMWAPHPDNCSEVAWQKLLQSMKRVVSIADKYDMTLAIETEASNVVMTPERARMLMDQIGYSRLKMIIDCANLFLPGQAHRENVDSVIQNAFQCFGKDIVLAHGKDIAGTDGIQFVPTGEGIVNFDLFLDCLKQYGYTGDILLHGIYQMDKMKGCIDFMQDKIRQHGLN